MADLKESKSYGTCIYPVHANGTSGLLRRCEPLLTPELLVSRYLKGIPVIFPNGDKFTPDELKDRINLAINEVELLVGTTVTREAFKEKRDFDWSLYKQFIHLRTDHGPIVSIESLSIKASNGLDIFSIPPEWIETANFHMHLINVIPLLAAFGSTTTTGTPIAVNSGAGAAFLAIWTAEGYGGHIPAYWEINYTSGLSNKEGQVPIPVNDLIGIVAAMDILSLIAPTNLFNSQSLSQDGISQSSSGPGPLVYRNRMDELEKKKQDLIKKLKGIFMRKYYISNF